MGNPDNIRCRSLWERRFCKYLDENKNVLRWGFELISIPYVSIVDDRLHKYIPDFIVETKNDEQTKTISIVEIKPKKQTIEPTRKNQNKSSLQEHIQYFTNLSKWETATKYCSQRGWVFRIITEQELFG